MRVYFVQGKGAEGLTAVESRSQRVETRCPRCRAQQEREDAGQRCQHGERDSPAQGEEELRSVSTRPP
ncbi:unnamed protein product [Gadus morhua 'NCC']